MPTIRLAVALSLVVAGISLCSSPARGGANPSFTLPLHAVALPATEPSPCDGHLFWDCQPGHLILSAPENPGGPESGHLQISFDCVTDVSLQVIGRMDLSAEGGGGCLSMVNPAETGVIQLLDCNLQTDAIDAGDPTGQARLGKVCVGEGGLDVCEPIALLPTRETNWGRIKGAYLTSTSLRVKLFSPASSR